MLKVSVNSVTVNVNSCLTTGKRAVQTSIKGTNTVFWYIEKYYTDQ